MACNKDEAIRAKAIAEQKLLGMDIRGADEFVLKGQSLFPELEGLSQLLEVVRLYAASEDRISGETNWYGILGVDPSATTNEIRTQYRRKALRLHPDKNKSVRAEEAFKILCEALNLLSDEISRSEYDSKFNIRAAPHQMVPTLVPTENPQTPVFYDFFDLSSRSNSATTPDMPAHPMSSAHNSAVPGTTNHPTPSRDTFTSTNRESQDIPSPIPPRDLPHSAMPGTTQQATPNRDTFTSTNTVSQDIPSPSPPKNPPSTSRDRPSEGGTFWTTCDHCKGTFSLKMKFLCKKVGCPCCQKPFIARMKNPQDIRNACEWTAPRFVPASRPRATQTVTNAGSSGVNFKEDDEPLSQKNTATQKVEKKTRKRRSTGQT